MPMVTTPRPGPVVTGPKTDGSLRPASFNATDVPAVVTSKVDSRTPAPARSALPPAPTPVVKNTAGPETKPLPRHGAPLVRLVNTKRITLNFEVKDVGPSGLSSVELWYTQDGKDWKKYDAPTQAQAYVVEVDEEGMYGFTLLAKSGTGISKDPPRSGDQPQVWVIVDLTQPDVQLSEIVPNMKNSQQSVAIKWKASDKNLGRQPVTLSYAEKEEGPWQVIATGLESTGTFLWQVPQGTPPRVLMRVEASDLAGNVGRAQSTSALLLDSAMPSVSIVNVEANGTH
jgi:hypothetical protein